MRLLTSLLVSGMLCLTAAGGAVFAQPAPVAPSAPGAGAWAPGPAAAGDRNSLAGVIDTPAASTTIGPGTLQVSGWFVDLTAQGWAGADDVEIFAGTIEGGGKPLGHAQFIQNRQDVAAALKNPFWAQAGWRTDVATATLPSGPTTLSVYVHTPDRGWWLRQVTVTMRAPTPVPAPRGTPTPATPLPPPTSTYGNDISYPQCPTGAEPPPPAFALVGVNAGKPFTSNPCLARQYFWALGATSPNQPRVGLYMNTANPGPTASTNWPVGGTAAPRACDGTWSTDCAFDYGWSVARDAFARAVRVVGADAAVQYPWWLDIESANSWSEDNKATNAASVQGALEYLRSAHVTSVGVYSTLTDWEALIGPPAAGVGPFGDLLNWRPGPSGPQDAPAWCGRTVTGGRIKFVQFPSGGFDTNLACF
jgi:hypothetical protein